MYSILWFVKSGFWLAVLIAWGLNHKRLTAWIETRITPLILVTNPAKVAGFTFRIIACIFLYFSFDNLLDATRVATFERVAKTISTSGATSTDDAQN